MKPWYKSTTLLFNLAAFVAAAGPMVAAYLVGAGVGEEVAGRIAGGAGLVSALVNLWLRYAKTNSAIAPIRG